MSRLYWMITITMRDSSKRFSDFFKEQGVGVQLTAMGEGTASDRMLDYFGLERTQKAVMFAVVTDETWEKAKKGLYRQMNIDMPGGGVAFTIPVGSVGGKRQLYFLTQEQPFKKEEESTLKETKFELVAVIANRGYSDMVMDAARQAGATGGTVIHANGTGMSSSEKFLGVSLASEKELVLIVARSAHKDELMKSIMENAGLESKAGSIVLSLPVTDEAGLRLLED